jgi:hypothetical protein
MILGQRPPAYPTIGGGDPWYPRRRVDPRKIIQLKYKYSVMENETHEMRILAINAETHSSGIDFP